MIYELEQPNDLTLSIACRFPEAQAVIEGNNPGWVFVDDLSAPTAALVWAQGIDGFYLVGDASSSVFHNELDFHIDQVLKPRLRSLGVDWFEISGDENWDPLIKDVLGKQELEISRQWVYILRLAQKTLTMPEAVDDCRLLKVNSHLLVNPTVSNKGFLLSRLTHFWNNVDAFLSTGLGYVLVDNEEIVSVCCSGFVTENIHAIDIETERSHRRNGYAEAVARAFLAECIKEHLQPYWDCMAENTASSQLAKKLGFTRSYEYTLYSFRL